MRRGFDADADDCERKKHHHLLRSLISAFVCVPKLASRGVGQERPQAHAECETSISMVESSVSSEFEAVEE